MLRQIRIIAATVAFSLFSSAPAHAISNGVIDTEHTNVGLLLTEFEGSLEPVCSGTLIAPQVFLVAAHCIAGIAFFQIPADQVYISLDIDPFSGSYAQAMAYHVHPDYFSSSGGDSHDLGIIELTQPLTHWNGVPVQPAFLPTERLLDQLSAQNGLRQVSFVNVGYGVGVVFDQGKPFFQHGALRRVSESPFMALTQNLLKLLMNEEATGEGGDCYGDSGGPHFLPSTNMIVAVQRGGDHNCRALSVSYRLDIPQARSFLGQYVVLP